MRIYVSKDNRIRIGSGIWVEAKRWGKKNEINIPKPVGGIKGIKLFLYKSFMPLIPPTGRSIYDWFPDTPRLIKWGEYCRSLGFSDGQVRDLVNMRPVRFSGELYSHEHSQHFEVENSEARLMRDEKGPGGFQLFIDRIPILRWFRQKAKEFLEHIGIKIKDRKQDRGMGMR